MFPEACIDFVGYIGPNGYGQLRVNGRRWLAHRLAYEESIGLIPEGLTIDHLCRNRRCINPGHMEAVDNVTNIMRGHGVGVVNAAQTHCAQGHEFTPENTYRGGGRPTWRSCRACGRDRTQRYRERQARR